ncbi:hypothetical protein G3I59_42545 [Amycolatopsis rubida]|uniref:Uncharacterized protein n=1 Tax=Amycolatopsis rubida TaxID=112413 RepID=A0A1I5EMG3_9PSEU|nr:MULTISPECIES: hypothetical protein [Amycolatopsis]MYW97123.1 hypothetical protein [Amycolatopsis rubida]NEC62108.1 hypothetical protein [Amycolatopsis rubida]OAP27344.1 hypothetical protein A4R44_02154 [Amycolatopsis sp. M39]SFO12231.1 hypothetical protein SAMN05421854_101695 [Amycolatopsis rubida]
MWEDTAFTVASGQAKATAPDGFVLEPDEAKQLLSKLIGVKEKLAEMRRKAINLCGMKAPAQDPSTLAAHVAMVGDGTSELGAYSYGGGHIDLQIAYVDEFIQRIAEALGMTKSNDRQQTTLINRVDPQETTE